MTNPKLGMPATIVSTDTSLLSDLSWTLTMFGYKVSTSSDWDEEAPWRRAVQSQLLLLDPRNGGDAAALLSAARPHSYTHRIALFETDSDAEELLAAGADDVVRAPVNIGELLTRMRSGVRRIEFERRLADFRSKDASSGFLTKLGLIRKMEKLDTHSDVNSPTVIVTCGVDYLDSIRQEHGGRAARRLIAALGLSLQQQLNSGDLGAVLAENVFQLVLPGRSVEQGIDFAENAASDLASHDTLVREIRSRPSLSAVVHEWHSGTAPEKIVEKGFATFTHLKNYGGNCVIDAKRVDQEIEDWRIRMDASTPFQAIIARDVMEAFPLVITQGAPVPPNPMPTLEEPASTAHLPACVPVVDDDGKLVRITNLDSRTFDNLALAEPEEYATSTIEFDQPLSDLFDAFSTVETGYLVVLEQERPVGYITCEGLASLVIDPLHANAYRHEVKQSATLSDLVVPLDVAPAAAASQALPV